MKVLYLWSVLVLSVLFASCGTTPRTVDNQLVEIPVQWNLFLHEPNQRTGKPIRLELRCGDRVLTSTTIPLTKETFEQPLTLPLGAQTITASVEGLAEVRFAVDSEVTERVQLWLEHPPLGEEGGTVAPVRIKFVVVGKNVARDAARGILNNENLVHQTVPITLTFYREDTGKAARPVDSSSDVPFRIFVDGNLRIDSVARAGNMEGQFYLLRVDKRPQRLRFEVPGEAVHECVIDPYSELWVDVHFWRAQQSTLKIYTSNGVVGVF